MDAYLPFIGPVVGLIGILIATFLTIRFNWWTNRKELTYQVLANSPLFSAEDEVKDSIEIFYNKKSVKSLSFLLIQVKNSGRANILKNDFEGELKLAFEGPVDILSVDVVERDPVDLPVEFEYSDLNILVKPLLLNSADSFKIKILIDSAKPNLTIEGRIAGVKSIKQVIGTKIGWQFRLAMFIMAFTISYLIYGFLLNAVFDYMKFEESENLRILKTILLIILSGGFAFITQRAPNLENK